MLGMEFMVGATIFSLIRVAVWVIIAALVVSLCRTIYATPLERASVVWPKIRTRTLALIAMVVVIPMMGTVIQPKITLEPPVNRELREYQTSKPDIKIVTPPPRSEKLDGFTPLKKD